MRTVARRDGNSWVINGRKIWATGAAAKSNVINVYVKTDLTVDYRKGMSLFLVPNERRVWTAQRSVSAAVASVP